MYSQFSTHSHIFEILKKGATVLTISALVLFTSPIPVVSAEEGDGTEAPTEETVVTGGTQETEPQGDVTEENQGDTQDEGGPTVIDTGDAVATSDVVNEVNTNIVDTDPVQDEATTTDEGILSDDTATTTEEAEEETATSTPFIAENENDEYETATSTATTTDETYNDEESANSVTNTEVTNENEADIENDAEVTADTGDNTASGNGDAIIHTGNAIAASNIVNIANTNIFNSTGFLLLLQQAFRDSMTLDLRNLDFFKLFSSPASTNATNPSNTTSGCSLSDCTSSGDTEIHNTNTANIQNTVIVRANSGGNTADNNEGAVIDTGDAYAASNVVNIANTNIIDSNYLLLSLSNFGSWNGDIILPGASFFSQFFTFANVNSGVTVTNNNDATIDNNVDVSANTGDNEANNDADGASINTGNAYASSAVANQANTNLFNTDSLLLMFRIHGNWSGNIFGLPDGFWVEAGDDGLAIHGGGVGSATSTEDSGITPDLIDNTNFAEIANNIQVVALTGDNAANGNGDASINTGNAYAASNVVNVVNTNVIGRNWVLALFNLLGDWNGNISFGRPDLWIGGHAELQGDPLWPNSHATYHYTITNHGDAPATNVTVSDLFDHRYLRFLGSDTGGQEHDGQVGWNIGTLNPGETKEVTYEITVGDNIPRGKSIFTNEATVTSDETDDNTTDNLENLSITTFIEPLPGTHGTAVTMTPSPVLAITKTNDASSTMTASSTVTYEITVKNTGPGPAYDTDLIDTLKDENGNVIDHGEWYIGVINPGEEIKVTYDIFYSADTTTGTYTNSAQIVGLGGYHEFIYGYVVKSNIATSDVQIEGIEIPDEQTNGAVAQEEVEEIVEAPEAPIAPEAPVVLAPEEDTHDEEIVDDAAQFASALPYQGFSTDHSLRSASTSERVANLLAASLFAFPDSGDEVLTCALPNLIFFYLLAYFVLRVLRADEDSKFAKMLRTEKGLILYFMGATAVAYVGAVFLNITCSIVPLLVIFLMLTILYFAEKARHSMVTI